MYFTIVHLCHRTVLGADSNGTCCHSLEIILFDVTKIVLVKRPHLQVKTELRKIWPVGDEPDDITVTTAHYCQGNEFDIVLLATTRTHPEQTRNDVCLHQRHSLSVAITRARQHLFVFGHCTVLESSSLWHGIVNFPGDQEEKQTYLLGDMARVMTQVEEQRMLRAMIKRDQPALQNTSGTTATPEDWNFLCVREIENNARERIERMGPLPAFYEDMDNLANNYGRMAAEGKAYLGTLSSDSDSD